MIHRSDTPAGAVFWPRNIEALDHFRPRLWRTWDTSKPRVAFVGLNPSTATADALDPTVRRCVNYAKAWGFGGMEMLNLWALRSTDPAGLWAELRAGGDAGAAAQDEGIREALSERVTLVVFASGPGSKGRKADRARVVERLDDVWTLVNEAGIPVTALICTKDGSPGHPLYLPGHLVPRAWTPGRWSTPPHTLGASVPLPRDSPTTE